jgi:hypothetical protein
VLRSLAGALVAREMGKNTATGWQPTDAEVDAYLEEALTDRSGPARFRRLFYEAAAEPSEARRRRLLAVLLAGPKAVPEPSDLHRVDRLVVDLQDHDVAVLGRLVEISKITQRWGAEKQEPKIMFSYSRGRVQYEPEEGKWVGEPVSPVAFYSLEAAGCVAIGTGRFGDNPDGAGRLMTVTPLGALVDDVLKREPVASVLAADAPHAR